MAYNLGISSHTIRHWLTGRTPFDMSHSVWAEVFDICTMAEGQARDRAEALRREIDFMRRHAMSAGPP